MTEPVLFELADRLAADTERLHGDTIAELRLVDDRRWPWVMLVPRVANAREIHDLEPAVCSALFERVRRVSAALQAATGCTSINVAALGNVVAQLHVHVVARDPHDPGWPGPVWGVGTPVRRAPGERPAFADSVIQAMSRLERD